MEDLLSTVLSEAGLDEFISSSELPTCGTGSMQSTTLLDGSEVGGESEEITLKLDGCETQPSCSNSITTKNCIKSFDCDRGNLSSDQTNFNGASISLSHTTNHLPSFNSDLTGNLQSVDVQRTRPIVISRSAPKLSEIRVQRNDQPITNLIRTGGRTFIQQLNGKTYRAVASGHHMRFSTDQTEKYPMNIQSQRAQHVVVFRKSTTNDNMQEIGRMPPVMRRFITRSNVSNISSAVGQAHLIKNHSIVDRSPSPVYLQRQNHRDRRAISHSSVHSETGHQYTSLSPPSSPPLQRSLIIGNMQKKYADGRTNVLYTSGSTPSIMNIQVSKVIQPQRVNRIEGNISGLCVTSNSRILHESYENTYLQSQVKNDSGSRSSSLTLLDDNQFFNNKRYISHLPRPVQVKYEGMLPQRENYQPINTVKENVNLVKRIHSDQNLFNTTIMGKNFMNRIERKDFIKIERKVTKDDIRTTIPSYIGRVYNEIEDEEENLGYAETYSDYCPVKLRSGLSHPDCVVETASLSSVAPPDVRYTLSIPEEIIDTGAISAIQLEAVLYACQTHETRLPSGERVGYLIGDGAGVGKGRIIASIIYENYILGRKRSLWLSISSDLKFDAERDLRDIGATNIKVHALNKFKYAKISGKENGNVKKGCVFATYSSLIGECRGAKNKYRTRLKQLIQWCGQDFDGVIILDECHRAKNLVPSSSSKPTKTGRVVMDLQEALPNARIVYASATGATEPKNMAYMTRLGLWGRGQAFPEFNDFINAVEKRGVGAMEVVAMDMKQRGVYLARQLSFRGVNFHVEEVALTPEFIEMYDESVKLWMECKRQFQIALDQLVGAERFHSKQVWGQFWAAHQRFFKYLCISAKVAACVKITREAIQSGKCVVIGLQSTGESKTREVLEDVGELTDFVSTAKAVLTSLIDKHFPLDRSNCKVDIFSDFDKIFNEYEKSAKRKRKNDASNMDGFETLASVPVAKKTRRLSGSSNTSYPSKQGSIKENESADSSDIESSDCSPSSEVENDDDNDGFIDGDEDAWMKKLMDQAKSSDEESEESAMFDEKNSEKEGDGQNKQSDDEINPFACDFTQEDPWAKKQQVVSDSPVKNKVQKRKKKRKKNNFGKKFRRTTPIETLAMTKTAEAFISSSRLIDNSSQMCAGGPSIIKAELLAAAERLGTRLPPNTLDELINELGGPEHVAEMTGRKGRIVSREDGEIEYELRHAGADVPLELMNMDEKDKFMKGMKLVAIISEAASSGISLQSDRRAGNRRRRVHITLELPWSADKAIQQFGRTHRSNQVSAPEYIFLISELAGEKRFASIVAKRLESLGALTHGDRRATETRDLSQFNLDTRYGRAALDILLRTVIGMFEPPLIPPPKNYKPGDFFADMRRYLEGVGLVYHENDVYFIENETANIPKFLNRILGLPVHAQNAIFQYFSDIVAELVAQAKHDGTYDMGIMDLGMGSDEARKLETRVFLGRVDRGSFRVEMHKIGVERGVSWEDAYAIWNDHHDDQDGFYLSTVGANGKKAAALIYGIGKKRLDTGARLYCITRPNTGRSPKLETMEELSKRFQPATLVQAEKIWKDQFEGSNVMCQHKYFHGRCQSETNGVYCETGRRTRTYFVLSGSVLSVWPVVEDVLSGGLSCREVKRTQRMQIIRVRTQQNQKIVGLLVLPQFVRSLISRLEEHCGRCFLETKNAVVS